MRGGLAEQRISRGWEMAMFVAVFVFGMEWTWTCVREGGSPLLSSLPYLLTLSFLFSLSSQVFFSLSTRLARKKRSV